MKNMKFAMGSINLRQVKYGKFSFRLDLPKAYGFEAKYRLFKQSWAAEAAYQQACLLCVRRDVETVPRSQITKISRIETMTEYLARGGQIKKIPVGVSSFETENKN